MLLIRGYSLIYTDYITKMQPLTHCTYELGIRSALSFKEFLSKGNIVEVGLRRGFD